MKQRYPIPIETANELFSYEPETGRLRYRETRGRKAKGDVAGQITDPGYIQVQIGKRRFMAHRVAWAMHYNEQPPPLIDHINRKPWDNRIANLRAITPSKNQRNTRRGYDNRGWQPGEWVPPFVFRG